MATPLPHRLGRLARGLALALLLALALGSCASMQDAREKADVLNARQREQADALFSAEEYPAAIDAYGQLLEAYPEDGYLYGQRGECYRRLARYQEAIADFTRAIELDPANAWAIANRGECYRASNQFDLAIQDLDRALELQPDNAWALASRGDAYRLQEQFEWALADLDRAVELDPEYQWALARRGETHRMREELSLALQDLDRAIQLAPEDSFAYASRGQVYAQQGEPEMAIADFDRAIQIDPEYTWAMDRREEALAQLAGDGDEPGGGEGADGEPSGGVAAAARPSGPLPLVTVLDFSIENMAKSDGRLIVDLVFSSLVSARRFRVLDRGQRDNVLKEVEFSLSACTDEKCQLEVGRLLAADRIVVGSLGKVGQRYILNAKMLDVLTGEALATAYKVFASLEEMVDGTEGVALSLSGS